MIVNSKGSLVLPLEGDNFNSSSEEELSVCNSGPLWIKRVIYDRYRYIAHAYNIIGYGFIS
jgi:hypothetical protein